jgi:non-lysosomal glucosylceramidase
MPAFVLDAVASNTAGLKTNLIMQDHLGRVHGFEGLGNDFGCCPGNCTHVWNYAQSMAFLFPSLERKIREVSFYHDTHENGYQCFRTTFPPGN